jgi:3-hydroxyisobutyrate dehydrogenase
VTEGGRSASFPLFLSSTTEQVLASGVSAGLGLIDDAGLVGVYLPKTPSLVLEQAAAPSIASTPEGAAKIKLVIQAMAGVHLVAAAEAMTLGARVGLDTNKLYEIISTAAGSSAMFVGRVPGLLSGEWSGEMTVGDVIAELVCLLLFPLSPFSGSLFLFSCFLGKRGCN